MSFKTFSIIAALIAINWLLLVGTLQVFSERKIAEREAAFKLKMEEVGEPY